MRWPLQEGGARPLGAEVAIVPGCKIDILTEHKKTNELVGIELKASEPDKGLVSQAGAIHDRLETKSGQRRTPRGATADRLGPAGSREFQSQVQALARNGERPRSG